ncbi:MAG: hypothetical protein EOO75_11255, partial [Myxococcales bacterium]
MRAPVVVGHERFDSHDEVLLVVGLAAGQRGQGAAVVAEARRDGLLQLEGQPVGPAPGGRVQQVAHARQPLARLLDRRDLGRRHEPLGPERHERFGGSVYLLEPDVKSGEGGLRDLDVVGWLMQARHGRHG